jgi:hypothetical protein
MERQQGMAAQAATLQTLGDNAASSPKGNRRQFGPLGHAHGDHCSGYSIDQGLSLRIVRLDRLR